MKRKISILLALIVAFALTVTAFAAAAPYYSDVNQNIKVYGPILSYDSSKNINDPAWVSAWPNSPVDAVLTWKHPSWPILTPTWISNPQLDINNKIILDPVTRQPVPNNALGWRWFTEAVYLCQGATNISGTIEANADNAEEVFVNGLSIGHDGTVQGTFIDGLEWKTNKSYSFDPIPGSLIDLNNPNPQPPASNQDYLTIDFIVRNGGTAANITGLAFDATINYTCPNKAGTQVIRDVSSADVSVYGPLNAYAAPRNPSWSQTKSSGAIVFTSPVLSPSAWPNYGTTLKPADWPSLGTPSNAKWISNTLYVGDRGLPGDPINKDSWRRFTQTICLGEGAPATVSGTVQISSDNANEVYVNGVLADSDGDMVGVPFDDHHQWNRLRVYHYNTPAKTISGTLYKYVAFDYIVRNGPGDGVSTVAKRNPTGLLFDATVDGPVLPCGPLETVKLTLEKVVINDNGGTATPADFTLTADGTGSNGKSGTSPVTYFGKPDTFVLSESGPAGYTAGTWSCVGNGTQNGNSITLADKQEATCTITNDDLPAPTTAMLHLRKVVVNDNDGTATPADFTLTATGTLANNNLSGTSPVDSDASLKADTFALSESGPDNYAASAWSCVGGTQNGNKITLAPNEEATCTITNNDIPKPRLHLRKVVVNDNGGTATAADFTLTADGTLPNNDLSGKSPVNSGLGLLPDTWTLSETSMTGYAAGSWSCTGGTFDGTNKITLAADQEATCTITNNDIAPRLHLRKVVINDNDGTATVADFTLKADGALPNNKLSGTSPVDSNTTLKADIFALSERGPDNYAASAWSCVGGSLNGNKITLGVGQEATCTITNNDIPTPRLHLRKVVVNDNGGAATVADFTLKADGTGSNDLSGTSPVNSGLGLLPDTWTLSETGPAGYSASAWSCVGGTQSGNTITLAADQESTCTITNNDIAPRLRLRKVVINDNGGTATVADFTLKADGTGANDLSGTSPVDSGATLKADTFALSESGPAGYTASAWSCVGGTHSGNKISLGIDQEATCTITNDDIAAPKLHLRKVVVNDNGGTATVADFTLKADGTGSNDLSGTSPVDSGLTLKPDTFALSESGPAGYTASPWNCVGGTQNGSNLTLSAGQEATCTITNNDKPAHLKLVKTVTNDNGGTAAATDFTLSAAGPTPISGAGGAESNVNPGTYTLSETGLAGYTAGSWSCTGGNFDGTNKVTLALGQSATCIINNNDQPAHLKLIKTVTNDNGGTAAATDFTLSAAGPTPISGAGGVASNVNAGTYTLSETSLPGYTAGAWSCSGGSFDGTNKVTLALGQSATCTINNNDQPAHLKLVKTVTNNNGGTATATDFTLSAAGPTPISGAGGAESTVNAGTYTLSETSLPGYAAGSWSCVGGTQNGNKITLKPGQAATCTINNDDIAPRLHLRKVVVNDNGGTATVADFTLTATGTLPNNHLSGTSPVDSGAGLLPDTWQLSETGLYGYSSGDWSCVGGTQYGSSITLGLGGEATCTITNDDQPGTIIIKKITSGANGTFNFVTTGTGYTGFSLAGGQQNSQTVGAGSYTVQEIVQPGWDLVENNCTVNGSGGSTGVGDLNTQTATIDLRNGDTVTCVFKNQSSGQQGITRTQGFWSTHPQLAETVWFGGTAVGRTFPGVGDNMLCGRPIDTLGKLMGGFWSNISKTSTGASRSALDQARMQLLQQLLAAELNGAAFGTVPVNGSIADWESAYCGTDQGAIMTALQQAESFNTSGDSLSFNPGGPADSKTAKSIATRTWWDVLP